MLHTEDTIAMSTDGKKRSTNKYKKRYIYVLAPEHSIRMRRTNNGNNDNKKRNVMLILYLL